MQDTDGHRRPQGSRPGLRAHRNRSWSKGSTKSYGTTVALAGVDLSVEAGTILGLLGPNGAGKTSLVSIVAGLRRPDAGRVEVCGIDVVRVAAADAPARSASRPRTPASTCSLRVRDNLRFFAGLAGPVAHAETAARIDEVADALGLTQLLDRRAAQLSGGERRRLHTAIALLHRPALVLLDEPTTGADVRDPDADPRPRAQPRRRRLGGRLLDALPPRDRRARRRRRVHRPRPHRRARQHRRARARARVERARADVRRRRCPPRRVSTARSSTARPSASRPTIRPRSRRSSSRASAPTRVAAARSRSCDRASSRCTSPSPGGGTRAETTERRSRRMISPRRVGVILVARAAARGARSAARHGAGRVPDHHDGVPQAGVPRRARAGRLSARERRRAGRSRPGRRRARSSSCRSRRSPSSPSSAG